MTFDYPEMINELPITQHLDEIADTLKSSVSRTLILTAETGAGKSTALPLALLKHFCGKILMLEPRRLAVLNIASRVAELLGEEPGNTCGYTMHLEKKVSGKTRFTVITEAILTRMLQNDPLLDGINVIVIDEFHERSIHTDLALAFIKETMQLRDDLYIVIMSATIDTEKVSKYMGTDKNSVPVISVKGRTFPVITEYEPDLTPSQAVKKELTLGGSKSILVFLPGIADIRKTYQELTESGTDKDTEIMILHSSVPFAEQKRVFSLNKTGKRRVILSSSIAETSLTVPDVGTVIDSGLSRVSIYENRIGMEHLVTERESLFNAEQRKGRAGRLSDGRCVRLWSQKDTLSPESKPEILRTDLSNLVLECYMWGVKSADGLSWLDAPEENAWRTAVDLLILLGCIRDDSITELGKAVLTLGINVRIACVALSGILFDKLKLSTALAVKYGSDPKSSEQFLNAQAIELEKRCQKFKNNAQFKQVFPQGFTEFSTEYALLCGYPDRLGVLTQNEGIYKFPSGRQARLLNNKATPTMLIAVSCDAGDSTGTIYESVPVSEKLGYSFMESKAVWVQSEIFTEGSYKLEKQENLCYGKLILKEKKGTVLDTEYLEAVSKKVSERDISWLPLSEEAENLLLRCQFYIQNCKDGDSFGAILGDRYKALKDTVKEWLGPFIVSGARVSEKAVYEALVYWLEDALLQKSVPINLVLANGKKRRLVYEVHNGIVEPHVEIIIQQAFGLLETPLIMGKRVCFSLLSPARRPLQITSDLQNFWQNTWPEICSEMKGRYPKHNWDYRVAQKD